MKRILQTLFFFLLVTQICFAQWIQVNGPCGGPVTTLAINSAGDIFAGTREHGVFRSTDNGNNWSQVNNGITDFDIRSIAINQSGHVFVGACVGVLRSTDNGESWHYTSLNICAQSIAINSNGHIFVGRLGSGGIYRSTDNGETWTSTNFQFEV